MITKVFDFRFRYFAIAIATICALTIFSQPVIAQSSEDGQLKQLRSDVGIHGLTANIHLLSDLTYKGNDNFTMDGSSELEFVYRNVRMMSPRLGVGYQLLTSFFVNGTNQNFGVGSWGVGPIVRYYPFWTNRFQPYVQLNSLFGNNMALSTLANTSTGGEGFRVRFGTRAGFSYRINNTIGVFSEVGYDWESSRIFRTEVRALQVNIGVDFYLFN